MRHRRVTNIAFAVILFGISLIASAQTPTTIELPGSTPCGTDANGKVHLSSRVQVDVFFIQMTSSLPGTVSVPSSIKVAKGGTFGTFEVRCIQATQSVGVTVTATANGGSASAFLNVLAPALQSITIQPHTGGSSAQAQATLIGRAPAGGVVVTLSSNSNKANVPQSVTVPVGVASAPFTISTGVVSQPTPVTILGTGFGVSKTAELIIQPPVPSSVTFGGKDGAFLASRNVVGGFTPQVVKVTLSTPAPTGYSVQLSSNNTAVVAVPPSVSFDGGSPDATFQTPVATVTQPTIVTITATVGGTSKSALLQVLPPSLDSFIVVPSTAVGGQTAEGRLRLNRDAPTGGIQGQLSSSNPAAVTIPATFTVPAGSTEANIPIQASRLDQSTTVTISALAGGVKRSAALKIEPEGPTSVTVSPGAVIGGVPTTVRVDRVPSPGILVVDLASNNAAATVPKSVTFSSMEGTKSVVISTRGVAVSTTVSITATKGAVVKGALLTVQPPAVVQLTISPAALVGGTELTGSAGVTTGHITISTPAPAGLVVSLSTNRNAVARPAVNSVTVPTGTTTATFPIFTSTTTVSETVGITASTASGSRTATLTVNPR